MKLITEFIVKHEEGPAVTAKRSRGGTWQFAWPGGTGTVATDLANAESYAEQIAEQVAKIEPLRDEIGEWFREWQGEAEL